MVSEAGRSPKIRTVGLDIATRTGMALVGDGEDRGKVIQLQKERGFNRLMMLEAEVERTVVAWRPDLAVIEAYAFARNVKSFTTLVECGTVCKSVLYRLRVPWVEVTPTTLKKWTTGKGNASKDEMAAAAKKWNFTSWSHDIVDAYALAQLGQLGLGVLHGMVGVQVTESKERSG